MKKTFGSLMDSGFMAVVKDASTVFFIKVAAALLALLFNAYIARSLPAGEVGSFYVFQSVVLIVGVFLRLGLDNVVLRESATDEAAGQVTALLQGAGVMIVALALVLALLAAWGLGDQSMPGNASVWMIALAAAVLAANVLYSEAYRGRRQMVLSQWMGVNGLGLYAGLLVGVVVLGGHLLALYVVSSLLVLLSGIWLWPVRTHEIRSPTTYFYQSRWLFLAKLFEMSSTWLPVIVLGYLAEVSDAGIFGPLYRLVLIASGVMIAFNMAGAPRFAMLHSSGDTAGLANLARKKTFVTVVLSAPVFLLFIVFPEWCLGIYGRGYAGYGDILVILAVAQLASVLSGPVGYLLIMSRHEKVFALAQGSGLLVNVMMLSACIPVWGIRGAALALAAAIAVQNLMGVFLVRRYLGFFTIGSWRRGLATDE